MIARQPVPVLIFLVAVLVVGSAGPGASLAHEEPAIGDDPVQASEEDQDSIVRLDRDPQGHEYASGELIVSYADGVRSGVRRALPEKVDARAGERLDAANAQLFVFDEVRRDPERQSRERVLERKRQLLEADPAVEAASYNYARRVAWNPNDPYFRDGKQVQLGTLRAPSAWDLPRSRGVAPGGERIKVAILDTGYDRTHIEFDGKVVLDYDFVNGDGYADDRNHHGTHVASIASSRTNNGYGIAGGCPNCELLIAKVGDARGVVLDDDVIRAIRWATRNGARAINMSFGGSAHNEALRDAINYAWNNDVVPVCAAGNQGQYREWYYPASYRNCVAVGSSIGSRRSDFSNYGPYVSVVAPGEGVWGAIPRDVAGRWGYGSAYHRASGTSLATPYVTALAGILAGRGLNTAGSIRSNIERHATDLGPAGRDDATGHGRADYYRSIANAGK
jgi:thermitase